MLRRVLVRGLGTANAEAGAGEGAGGRKAEAVAGEAGYICGFTYIPHHDCCSLNS